MCGDSTVAADVERLLGGANVDSIVTDPPYSSDGFQESDRSAGSKGTAAVYKPIRNDRLSTRGYQALIKGTLALVPISVSVVYVFTDWRMWVNSSGPHHQDSGEAKIRESTAGVSRKPSSDGKACGCSSKHLCGLTAWNT